MKKYLKLFIFIICGTAAGYLYYHYYGCTAGCPLTSKWYVTSVYGAVMGLLLGLPGRNKLINNDSSNPMQ
jgi:phage shock protein E